MSKRKEKEINEIRIRICVCFILNTVREEREKNVFFDSFDGPDIKNIYFNIKKEKVPESP